MPDSTIQKPPGRPPATPAVRGRFQEGLRPLAYKMRRVGRSVFRRILRRPRSVSESPNLLPLLIRVLAGFSNYGGNLHEEEVDSALDFLRHDYPETVYSELQAMFRQALNERPDLNEMAANLAAQLSPDRKMLLGIQLYDLISRAGQRPDQVAQYYSFMSRLGMGAQAIDIVYQLNAPDSPEAAALPSAASPLESLSIGPENSGADVTFRDFASDDRIALYRFHDLLLLKNLSPRPLMLEGRILQRGTFGRLFPGQRVVLNERVLTHQDLVAYFNAKKNVAVPVVWVSVDKNDEVNIQRARNRESGLEIRFGLKVDIRALKDLDAVVNGVALKEGVKVTAALEDRIIFHDDTELLLLDLRRRARAMGGRFQLNASKSEYLVSNNPSLLGEDDILLSPGTGGEVLLKITCDYDEKRGQLEVLQTSRPIMVGDQLVRNTTPLADGDLIVLDAGQSLRCDFTERILEEERNVIRMLEVRDLGHTFGKGQQAFDGISFAVERGEMVCVMGASGCGKSSLLLALAGHLRPQRGGVFLNSRSLYDHHDELKTYISYIPQDDAFDEQLTIAENLSIAASLRSPHLTNRDRMRRVDGKLAELGLAERRNSVVGSPVKKSLSGGERKRLNIGLDMIGLADIYLFDEPTSGLSSKDSEHVIDIIRGMSHNKIVLVTIHQPSSKIFQMFQKVVLLDRGGRLVFFGTPQETLEYFATADHEQHYGTSLGGCEACGTTRPEFIFDVLETPLRDLSGDIIYEENQRGQLVPARRFSPDFWRDKYESHRLLRDMRSLPLKRATAAVGLPYANSGPAEKSRQPIRWREELTQFRTQLKRAFLSKLRNRVNLMLTGVLAPGLAALTAFVLRYSESGDYDFASAFHIATYVFIGLTVAMFFGLTNSVNDILRDRVILQRERNLQLRLGYYIGAKLMVLALFALIQCVLFVLVGNLILEVRGMFWLYLTFMSLTALCGVAIGMLVSSVFSDAITAVNILPLILIPQIIMSGALIKFEDMNRHLDFHQTITRWLSRQSEAKQAQQAGRLESRMQVPLICELMPMRWSYEALVVGQAKFNPLTRRQEEIQARINILVPSPNVKLSPAQSEILETDKDLLAALSGLEGDTPRAVDRRLRIIDSLAGKPLNGNPVFGPDPKLKPGEGVTAESLYVNQKISDLVSKAEMEQVDYRAGRDRSVFFSPTKYIFGKQIHVLVLNALVLLGISALAICILFTTLWRQLRRM